MCECAYCGRDNVSGLDRTDSSLGYLKSNVVPACKDCNFAKNDKSIEEFCKWAKKLQEYQLDKV